MEFNEKQSLIDSLVKSCPNTEKLSDIEKYAAYCWRVKTEKARGGGQLKNPWFNSMTVESLDRYFRQVRSEGLVFDGENITIQKTGISYNFKAYKNKMLNVYPSSLIDVQLVFKADAFCSSKSSGSVLYKHEMNDVFSQKDEDIVGAYCVIKNPRGEFITTLGMDDMQKHRGVAKTDYIWKAWFKEMCLKTIIKKACRIHFDDIFKGIEEMDNEQYELVEASFLEDKPIDKLKDKVRGAIKEYEGEDKEEIRHLCTEAQKEGRFTDAFAEEILRKMGAI